MLRFLTAGESHGQGLVVILEGLPAGLPVTEEDVRHELARRRLGYGRGPRMRFEQDEVTLLGGVRHGRTLGSPLAIVIGNSEWASGKWNEEMSPAPGATTAPLTTPRPGHADLAGMQKYDFTDARDVLERASARETAARVAAGAVAKVLLRALGIEIVSHVVALGPVRATAGLRPQPEDLDEVDASAVRCFDGTAEAAMVDEIKAAAKQGDSLGGVVEVLGYGLPVGLGSHVHWDRKLDGLLAQALMSIQAVKGVEMGDGFEVASRRGSEAHDAISWDDVDATYRRATSRAGGLEGGMSNGEVLVAHVAMKPLATLNRPSLGTVDTVTKAETVSFKERTDVTAVPAMGVVAETMTALVLADEVLRKFGGDSLGEVMRNHRTYLEQVREHDQVTAQDEPALPAAPEAPLNWDPDLAFADPDPLGTAASEAGGESGAGPGQVSPPAVAAPGHVVLVGMMGVGKTTVGRWLAQMLQRPFVDSDELVEARTGHTVRELFESSGEAAFRAEESAALVEALGSEAPLVVAAAGGTVLDPANRERLLRASAEGGIVVWLRADASVLADRVGSGDHRPLLQDDPAVTLAALAVVREPLYREVADVTIDEAGPDGSLTQGEVSALVLAAVAPGVVHALRSRRQAQTEDPAGKSVGDSAGEPGVAP